MQLFIALFLFILTRDQRNEIGVAILINLNLIKLSTIRLVDFLCCFHGINVFIHWCELSHFRSKTIIKIDLFSSKSTFNGPETLKPFKLGSENA